MTEVFGKLGEVVGVPANAYKRRRETIDSKMTVEMKKEILRLLREDEEFRYAVAGLLGLEEVLRRLDRHEKELVRLREDMNKLREDMMRGFEIMERHLSAIGARWGLMTESAFREGLKGILEKELGLKVERWREYDDTGRVHGYPSYVEIDISVKDGKTIVIEVKSHASSSDIFELSRKARFYEEKTGRAPERILIVTPFADEKAFEAAIRLGVEIYTKV